MIGVFRGKGILVFFFLYGIQKKKLEKGKILIADINHLPVNPLLDLPKGYLKSQQ